MGFSQRIAQNAGDLAEIAAQVFAPAAVGRVAKSSFVAAGVTKFRSNVIGAFTKTTKPNVSMRFDIIKEQEMIQRALAAPTEWNGQFKLIREIQPGTSGNEFASNVYCREVVFRDPKTQQMFRAFQRNDIDPGYVHQSGRYIGQTNLEVMRSGYAPRTNAGEPVIIHHMGQSAYGPFVEMAEGIHRKQLWHNQFGARQLHPTAPVIRSEFDSIREAYWRSYAEAFK